jgi:hypothetical protein
MVLMVDYPTKKENICEFFDKVDNLGVYGFVGNR